MNTVLISAIRHHSVSRSTDHAFLQNKLLVQQALPKLMSEHSVLLLVLSRPTLNVTLHSPKDCRNLGFSWNCRIIILGPTRSAITSFTNIYCTFLLKPHCSLQKGQFWASASFSYRKWMLVGRRTADTATIQFLPLEETETSDLWEEIYLDVKTCRTMWQMVWFMRNPKPARPNCN